MDATTEASVFGGSQIGAGLKRLAQHGSVII